MKKWCRAVLFLLPLFIFTGWVNWYVDSYAILRVTYDDIAAQMEAGKNVEGLEESDYNDRIFWRRVSVEWRKRLRWRFLAPAVCIHSIIPCLARILFTMRGCPRPPCMIFWL